jgi:hypothetical protein
MNDWTVMVYLAGENNLAEEMVYALKTMQLIGSNPELPGSAPPHYEVFALFDGGVAPVTLSIDPRDAPARCVPPVEGLLQKAVAQRREEGRERVKTAQEEIQKAEKAINALKKHKNSAELNSKNAFASLANSVKGQAVKPGSDEHNDIIKEGIREKIKAREIKEDIETSEELIEELEKDLKEARKALKGHQPLDVQGVDDVLREFMIDTIENHPARHYMLVLSGHGSGAVGDFLTGTTRLSGLSIPDLGASLAAVQKHFKGKRGEKGLLKGGKIDILGLDSCLMGMAEVAYEVRNYVQYLVGAEGFTPNTGWPYDRILNLFRTDREPRGLAQDIVREYIDYYTSDYALADVSTDMAALDLSEMGPLASALAARQDYPDC